MARSDAVPVAEIVRRLRALPVELGSKGGGPLRYALFQGVKVVQAEAKALAPRKTGALDLNIVAARNKNPRAIGATEAYALGMKGGTRQFAKVSSAGRVLSAAVVYYGRMVELGTSKMAARSFLARAADTKVDEFYAAVTAALAVAVARAEKKLGGTR